VDSRTCSVYIGCEIASWCHYDNCTQWNKNGKLCIGGGFAFRTLPELRLPNWGKGPQVPTRVYTQDLLSFVMKCKFFFLGFKECSENRMLMKFIRSCWWLTRFSQQVVRASPMVLSMWSCTIKLDEENPKYARLAQENGFGSA
jgi:hypothetical protein